MSGRKCKLNVIRHLSILRDLRDPKIPRMVRLMRRWRCRGDGGEPSDAVADWRVAPDVDRRGHRCSRRLAQRQTRSIR